VTNLIFETTAVAPIEYFEDADYWTSSSFSTQVKGILKIDGVDQTLPANAYGIDLEIQDLNISDHWDFLAGEYAGDANTISESAWGAIIGDIEAQKDLNDKFETKANAFYQAVEPTVLKAGDIWIPSP
jgi:hypothetical protein